MTKSGHVYTPARTAKYEAAVRLASRRNRWPTDRQYKVSVWFYHQNRRALADVDNLLKSILDGCQGSLWTNDKQVSEVHAWRMFDKDRPRVEVEVEVLE